MTIPRRLAGPLRTALRDTPAVLVVGARQVGKTTLVRHLLGDGATYRTLDRAATRDAARRDPDAFVASPGTLIIDEIQRVPELLPAVKARIDDDRRPGMFVLTGSADVLTLPAVSESLAGRVEVHELCPLSAAEMAGAERTFIDLLTARDAPMDAAAVDRADLIELLLRGGFPDARTRALDRQSRWYESYLETVIQREVPSIADMQYADQLPRLLRLVAAGSPGALNISSLTTRMALPRTTVDRYLAVLAQVFLLRLLPPWHANVATRQVKSRRSLVCDSGLLAWLLELEPDRLASFDPDKIGPLLETFVAAELRAQAGWQPRCADIAWWRTAKGEEVDLVLSLPRGELTGIEVKASSSVGERDARGLRRLRAVAGDRLQHGIVLYTGNERLPLGDGFEAWPLSLLWGGGPAPLDSDPSR